MHNCETEDVVVANRKKPTLINCALLTVLLVTAIQALAQDTDIRVSTQTEIGELKFENGYVTDEMARKVYDEIDLHRATQAYLWSMPLVSGVRTLYD